jgi:hypothetical protein
VGILDVLPEIRSTADCCFAVFFKICRWLDQDLLEKFCRVLWSLWKRRNMKLSVGVSEECSHVLARAAAVLQARKHAWPDCKNQNRVTDISNAKFDLTQYWSL